MIGSFGGDFKELERRRPTRATCSTNGRRELMPPAKPCGPARRDEIAIQR